MHARKSFVILVALVGVLFGLAPIAVRAADDKKESTKAKPIVAVFRLRGPIVETPGDENPLFGTSHSMALVDLIQRLAKARDDEAVKGVVFTLDGATVSLSSAEEIRQAMAAVRAAGKEVYVFADGLTMSDYALAAGASEISVVPTGDLWLTGIYVESPYVRGLLSLLGVSPDFLHCGDYKSASEIFMRDGPSPQAEEMQNWLLDSLYQSHIRLIATGRDVDEAKAREWIDGGPYTASGALKAGLIDKSQQRSDLEASLRAKYGDNVKFDSKYGAKAGATIDFSSPMGMMSFYSELLGGGKKKKAHKDSVAVVYVEGSIELGAASGSPLSFGGKSATSVAVAKALDEAADDDTVKAVVLRVNSPGGSATASDVILAATKRVKAKKPLVVSMGDVAGSGGYYVACASDVIFADASTITGSIGVIGGKMATSDMWGKVGIRWKEYGRGANASILSTARPFTAEQRQRMQAWMDEIYGVFKDHVTAIRGSRLKKPIDELAGGRVYTGQQALDLGLIDRLGTLSDAIKYVAEQAKIEKYEIRVVPESKNFIEQLLSGLTGGDEDDAKGLSLDAGRAAGFQAAGGRATLLGAALPYLKGFDPERVSAVTRAFLRLEMIRREGAVLMMPEISVRN
ncbi:MAG TPA: signal peptide peptidase SppA [Pirellulales bacterium]|jgi:protease-4